MIPNIFICDKKHLKFGVQTADSHFAMASVTQEAHSTLAKRSDARWDNDPSEIPKHPRSNGTKQDLIT